MQPQLLTSKNEHWCTPKEVIDRLVFYFGSIDLDPCSNSRSIVNAKLELDPASGQDGLVELWHGQGFVYVNPPYGHKLKKWTRKIAAEATLGTEMVVLVPARTDTKWFHDNLLPHADSLVFIKGRLRFIDGLTGQAADAAPFPSMLVYFGPRKALFRKAFEELGFVTELR